MEHHKEYLSPSETLAYCRERGLIRTPKTIRDWGKRASRDGEVDEDGKPAVCKQDTENGFRYVYSRKWLDLKIEQDLPSLPT